MVRIAVASTDGKTVDLHFGKAGVFYIIEADEDSGELRIAEKRDLESACNGSGHDEERIRDVCSNLLDVDVVLVSKIGERARNILEGFGLDVYEISGKIDELVDRLIRYRKVQKLIGRSR